MEERAGKGRSSEYEGGESGQELLNWSFDWTHRDGLNVISDWPGGEGRDLPPGDARTGIEGREG